MAIEKNITAPDAKDFTKEKSFEDVENEELFDAIMGEAEENVTMMEEIISC